MTFSLLEQFTTVPSAPRKYRDIVIARQWSVDEFILGKSRFQLPSFTDLAKWNNRVVTNLLYYQTNYLALAVLFALLSCFIHAKDIVVGISAIGLLVSALLAGFSKNPKFVRTRSEHPYVVVVIAGAIGYYFIYVLPSIIILLFSLAVPLLVIFVHASIRLRNLSAKINEKVEKLHLRQTLMGQLLDLINVDIRE